MARLRAVDVDLIAQFEGFRGYIYDDADPDEPYAGGPVGGTLTIGYGDTDAGVLEQYANGITEPEARELLARRADEYAAAVLAQLTRSPTPNQLGALASLVYNIGPGAPGKGGFYESTVRRRFNEGDVAGAAQAFGMWVKSDGRTLQGLVDRREAEIVYFLTPDDTPDDIAHTRPHLEVPMSYALIVPAGQSVTVPFPAPQRGPVAQVSVRLMAGSDCKVKWSHINTKGWAGGAQEGTVVSGGEIGIPIPEGDPPHTGLQVHNLGKDPVSALVEIIPRLAFADGR